MLGWEYPPYFNGGLGVACSGLCDALSDFCDILLVVPKSSDKCSHANYKILGLNNVEDELVEENETISVLNEKVETYQINIDLNPYYTAEERRTLNKPTKQSRTVKKKKQRIPGIQNIFGNEDLYGNDVIRKVILYAEMVKKISAHYHFDIIHAHDWMTFLAGMEVKRSTGKPLILHIHSLDYDRAGSESRSWIYDVERSALHEADLIIPVSNYTGKIIVSHYGVNSDKIYPVHNGISPVKPFRNAKNFPEQLVLFIGRLTGQKGPEYFLEVASKIHGKYPNVRFVIAGTGEQLTHLLEDGAYKQIGNRVHFTGFLDRNKINDLLAIADVYCMPSVSEPFGLTALEAAQFGIPTVISERSGVAEVLPGALKADFWDIDLMADHIVSLLSNKNIRDKVVQQNYSDLKSLTWQNAAKRVVTAYHTLLHKN